MADDPYLSLTPRERLELLDAASRQRGLAPAILEKDYWVCKTLDALFALPELGSHLVFKGGTSLSKVYGLIDRFSEDVDVSFHRDFLGFGEDHDPEAATGQEQNRRIKALQLACIDRIRDTLLPSLHEAFGTLLGGTEGWSLEIDPADPQTLLFHFPRAGGPGLAYIAPAVRIELGARSDHWPAEDHPIRSHLGETFDQPIGLASVRSLAAERTFWEKATILHAEAHRDPAKPMPARHARHYHDLARMAAGPVAERALADAVLRERVVIHKSVYFRSGWARYELAVPATFRLLPPRARLPELEADHRAMVPMFFSPPPPIGDVLATLAGLETRIRSLS
ncbi:MAG: nucleotidyl transferase AbiEii/AbiGii toxin family protein [Verrucomicrobiaceae bacterium]|nr:MAG: nucleotidyl transferase AbiEii/AbiGii toxin family protein [Verrucomicrobiaceae bacterium]